MHDDDALAATRRELLLRGAALGTAAAVGALPAAARAASQPTDADLLMPVLGSELLAVFAYGTILHSNLMSENAQKVATRLLVQEHSHVATFTNALQVMGATPPQELGTVNEADQVLAAHGIPNRLAHLRTERDCLTILVRVENVLGERLLPRDPRAQRPAPDRALRPGARGRGSARERAQPPAPPARHQPRGAERLRPVTEARAGARTRLGADARVTGMLDGVTEVAAGQAEAERVRVTIPAERPGLVDGSLLAAERGRGDRHLDARPGHDGIGNGALVDRVERVANQLLDCA